MRRLAASLMLAFFVAGTASAHGVYTSSSPSKGERVRRIPPEVRVTLSEAPAQGSTMRVVDGCGRNVAEAVALDGADLVASIGGAPAPEPGAWKVAFRSISSVDGHAAKERFAFSVRGQRDCARDEGPTEEEDEIATPPPVVTANDDTSSSFPWIPFALGTLALVAIAFFVRRAR
jgi:methionine-rich copper-binding protein CopC